MRGGGGGEGGLGTISSELVLWVSIAVKEGEFKGQCHDFFILFCVSIITVFKNT